ncbi:MAG: large-conductance mechanosensitive channel protein MscL [Chitinophagales bacterium]|nr:large-conductance mechanosensitive channel protein MscL [Chitinophagales bacterium]
MGMLKEYKEFISRGNVVDLAVGVVIGGAFGKIVGSLVNDIVMPPIGLLLSGVNFKDIKWVIRKPEMDAAGAVAKPEVAINIGNFIQVGIEFLIIAWVIFLVVKGINSMKKKEEAAPAAPPEPTAQEKLLAEIRDLLKK